MLIIRSGRRRKRVLNQHIALVACHLLVKLWRLFASIIDGGGKEPLCRGVADWQFLSIADSASAVSLSCEAVLFGDQYIDSRF